MLDRHFAEQFANDWIDSWNSHDLERIVSHYAESLEFNSPLILERYPDSDGVITTRTQLQAYFAKGLALNPALQFTLLDILTGNNGLILYYENARGGHTAELFEFDSTGKVKRAFAGYGA